MLGAKGRDYSSENLSCKLHCFRGREFTITLQLATFLKTGVFNFVATCNVIRAGSARSVAVCRVICAGSARSVAVCRVICAGSARAVAVCRVVCAGSARSVAVCNVICAGSAKCVATCSISYPTVSDCKKNASGVKFFRGQTLARFKNLPTFAPAIRN